MVHFHAAIFGSFSHRQRQNAAEDSVQDALANAFAAISQLRDPSRFRAWLSRITLNICRMHLRQVSDVPDDAVTADLSPAPETGRGSDSVEVGNALALMDRETRRLLHLFSEEGLSHIELAECLSLSRSAVKSRLHRAREQLRKEMLKMMTPEQKASLGVTEEEPWVLRTILLVELDQPLQAAIRNGLAAAGYEVVTLPSGQAALEAAKERRGQMLVMDKNCGEPNWVEVLTLLQTDAWARENMPVAAVVDPNSERDVFLAWGAGAAICLARPPGVDELVGFVKKLERLWPEELRPKPWTGR